MPVYCGGGYRRHRSARISMTTGKGPPVMAELGPVETAIPSGIGRTAMYMSLIRHHESGRPDALFRDPFAEVVTTRLAGTPELAALATLAARRAADVPARRQSQGTTFLSARDDLVGWLGGHRWSAEVQAGSDPAIGHGRAGPPSPSGWLGHAVLP
jgi:hypothetical protein